MIIRWMTVLGIVGFLGGFLGPMLLAPDANQGPMLGIFITGPGGAVLGMILGLMVSASGWSKQRNNQMLIACSVILAAVTLYFCIPSPRYLADVVEGTISSCVPVDSLREKTIDSLNAISAKHSTSKPIQWSEKFDQFSRDKPGVVINMHVARIAQVFEKQALWSRGDLVTGHWTSSDRDTRYFADYAGNDCMQYSAGTPITLKATGNLGIWPPYGIAEMLNVKTAQSLPGKYSKLIIQN